MNDLSNCFFAPICGTACPLRAKRRTYAAKRRGQGRGAIGRGTQSTTRNKGAAAVIRGRRRTRGKAKRPLCAKRRTYAATRQAHTRQARTAREIGTLRSAVFPKKQAAYRGTESGESHCGFSAARSAPRAEKQAAADTFRRNGTRRTSLPPITSAEDEPPSSCIAVSAPSAAKIRAHSP